MRNFRWVLLGFVFIAASGFVTIPSESEVSAADDDAFVALTPKRLLDTRSGDKVGELDGSGDAYSLQVTGKKGVPSSGVSAVTLNVTAVSTEAGDFGGYVTVYPCGTRPNSSNLNFVSGQTIPNSVIVRVPASGKVCFYVYGKAHILADVSGYFTSGFSAMYPKRLLDTRSGDMVGELDGSGAAYSLQVTGKKGVPSSGVTAVALNVTAVSTEAGDFGGFVTVYPCGTRPDASNLNFTTGQTIPNSVIAPVSSSGKVCFYVYGKAHLLADVSGYLGSAVVDSTVDPNALSFDLDDAVGVALTEDTQTRTRFHRSASGRITAYNTSSNLLAVKADGSTSPATRSGVADISRLLIAPNNFLYVLFNQRVNLADTSLECSFFQSDWNNSWDEISFKWVAGSDGNGDWQPVYTTKETTEGWWSFEEYQPTAPDGSIPDGWSGSSYYRYVPCDPPCLLGEVDPDTGYITCIDNTLDSIWWNDWDSTSNQAIQFDDDGNVYYHGYGTDNDGDSWAGILRMYRQSDSKVIDLVTDNVDIRDFLVTGDGRVYLSGQTNSTSDDWFRVLVPVAGQERPRLDRISTSAVQWMFEFPDGNVYYAGECCDSDYQKVKTYDPESESSSVWLFNDVPGSWWAENRTSRVNYESTDDDDKCGDSPNYNAYGIANGVYGTSNPYFYEDEDGDGYCWGRTELGEYNVYDYGDVPDNTWLSTPGCYEEGNVQRYRWRYPGYDSDGVLAESISDYVEVAGVIERTQVDSRFCSEPYQLRQQLHRTIDGKVYGVAGWQWGDDSPTSIGMYYPTPRLFTTAVVNATTVLPVLDKMFLTGLDENEDYITTYLNLSNNEETTIIDTDEDLEIYHLSFLASNNRLMFDGLRFADNNYVIGYVDMATGDVLASATGGQRMIDFQLFS